MICLSNWKGVTNGYTLYLFMELGGSVHTMDATPTKDLGGSVTNSYGIPANRSDSSLTNSEGIL